MADQATSLPSVESIPAATSEAETLRLPSDSPELTGAGLTDAELEVLTAPAKPSAADVEAAAEKQKADDAAAEAAEKAKADKVDDKPAVKAEATKADAPVFVPKMTKGADRDFDKELADLEAKYADPDGDLSLEDFNKASRQIQREQIKAEVKAEIDADTQKSAAEYHANLFNATIKNFFDDPAHQDFVKDDKSNATPEFRSAFQKACDFVDDGKMSNADVVSRAYATLKITRGDLFATATKTDDVVDDAEAAEKKAADEKAEADKQAAIAKRKPNTKDLPVTLTPAPNAGADRDDNKGSTVDELAALPLDALEARMALMRPDQLDEILRSTPGSSARGTE